MEHFGNVEETNDVAFFIADRLRTNKASACTILQDRSLSTYQVSETSLHHELESLGGTSCIASDHGIRRHDLTNLGGPRVKTRRGDLIYMGQRVSIITQLRIIGVVSSPGMPSLWQ